jgi:hypothetical protein
MGSIVVTSASCCMPIPLCSFGQEIYGVGNGPAAACFARHQIRTIGWRRVPLATIDCSRACGTDPTEVGGP